MPQQSGVDNKLELRSIVPHSALTLPGWALALVAVLYYAGAKLGMLTVMPEGMAILWPANAVVLAALLRFGAARLPAIGLVVVAAEVIADVPAFSVTEAVLFGLINFAEATAAFVLLRRLRFDAAFASVADAAKFLLAGPIVCAFLASLLGAAVYTAFRGGATGYLEFARIWWFGDGLGLLILTPLLLGFAPFEPAAAPRRPFSVRDALLVAAAALVFAAVWMRAVPPVLLVPVVLVVAARYEQRWTALAVAASAGVIVAAMAHGRDLWGGLPGREAVIHAQEFIFVLALLGLGCTALLSQLRRQQAELEGRVAERTRALEQANAELGRLATVDALTGVGNRRLFDRTLASEASRVGRYGGALALVLADLDHFKRINDVHGHAAGDEQLRAVGGVLRDCARASDLVARYGGEEFAILLPHTDAAQALQFAERVRRALARQAGPAGERVTASFGVAQLGPEGDVAQLVAAADAALYRAKAEGRDRVVAAPAIGV